MNRICNHFQREQAKTIWLLSWSCFIWVGWDTRSTQVLFAIVIRLDWWRVRRSAGGGDLWTPAFCFSCISFALVWRRALCIFYLLKNEHCAACVDDIDPSILHRDWKVHEKLLILHFTICDGNVSFFSVSPKAGGNHDIFFQNRSNAEGAPSTTAPPTFSSWKQATGFCMDRNKEAVNCRGQKESNFGAPLPAEAFPGRLHINVTPVPETKKTEQLTSFGFHDEIGRCQRKRVYRPDFGLLWMKDNAMVVLKGVQWFFHFASCRFQKLWKFFNIRTISVVDNKSQNCVV